jgi:hypothetical protein
MSSAEIKMFGWIIQPCLLIEELLNLYRLWVLVVVVKVGAKLILSRGAIRYGGC